MPSPFIIGYGAWYLITIVVAGPILGGITWSLGKASALFSAAVFRQRRRLQLVATPIQLPTLETTDHMNQDSESQNTQLQDIELLKKEEKTKNVLVGRYGNITIAVI
jgi:hypothetical protein